MYYCIVLCIVENIIFKLCLYDLTKSHGILKRIYDTIITMCLNIDFNLGKDVRQPYISGPIVEHQKGAKVQLTT